MCSNTCQKFHPCLSAWRRPWPHAPRTENPHLYRPGKPSRAATALPRQARSQPAAFGDPVRQSSWACFSPEGQFLLSAPWAAPRMLSSCGYLRQKQNYQPQQLFPCLLPSSHKRFWAAQLGHSLEQPATVFHGYWQLQHLAQLCQKL